LETLWNRFHKVNIEKLIGKVDIFHSSDWLQPPSQAVKITTIHDLIIYRYPESFSRRGGHNIVENQKRRLNWVKKESDLILADSQSTKSDIVSFLEIPEKKVKVVYLAADESFKPQPDNKIKQVKEKYKLNKQYILCVGAREPRKNFEGAINAFNQLDKNYQDFDLVIVGKFGWGEDTDKFKVQSAKLKVLGFVPQEDLPALYSGASCFVYPSFYEGFGLPVLEAMSCGCSVVTTNKGSLAEIAGNAAQLVDPLSIENICDGIKKAIKNRSDHIEAGFKQAAKFSWNRAIKETLQAYREVYK